MNRIHYSNCPVCGSALVQTVLEIKDHSVSGETFPVAHCAYCTFRFTQDVPGANDIGPYYQSEEYISHTNTSKGLINNLYQKVRKRTLRQKRNLITKQTCIKAGKLLDIGSGTGAFANEMKTNGWDVTGLEPDPGARKLAKELYGIDLSESSILFNLPSATYDVITLWHVLEHVHDLSGYVTQFKRLLKPGGKLLIAVPNYTSGDAHAYKTWWAAWDVPRHLWHFSPQSMQELLKSSQFKLEVCKPMWYDSFYVSMLSSKYKNGKTNLFVAVWTGFWSNAAALFNVKKCSSVIYIFS